MMAWASELPGELLCQPMGLVILSGLDTTYNAVHKAIWDSFCNNRRHDRVPLQFRVLGVDHEYPKCRSRRTSYEWYIPKGILKTSWMKKHLEQIPAVVIIFFDLDWDEGLWKERQMECATKVQIIRDSLQGRGSKVAVVLVQKNAPFPPGEDVVAAERAASLCSACDLSAKSLFVLPLTDHLLGYTIRLENAFYELSQTYYHTEARRVKAHKEFLNKTTHQLLYVRHQFKIAFFNELKHDTHTALKHYRQAYGHLLELRMHDTNLLEIKANAGFINYKVCRLSFQHNAPLDAIAQFRKHIDFFKSKVGIAELAFEHSAWMSKQFQVFGDLFDEAIKLGLTAIQTQHPGFYYQQAANHASSRKQLCLSLCHPSVSTPSPDPLESLADLDYYGQRPWRQGHQSIDPPDALKERDGIQALQAVEVKLDHSWQIIPLLSSAVAQFKKYKSPRMKRFLMVQMGEEYYHAKDYTKALTLLSRVTWDYRQEQWWPLLTNILVTALRCAYLSANVQEYITIALELIGKYTLCSQEEKTRVQMNLIRVMSNDPPEPEPGCNTECLEKSRVLWKTETSSSSDSPLFTVEMQSIVPFVECKARFMDSVFMADTLVNIEVHLRTSCPFPIRFSKLSVLLNNQAYSQHCVLCDGKSLTAATVGDEGESGDLYLVPSEVKVHLFSFYPQAEDVGKTLEITSLALELGTESARCAILHWTGGGGVAVVPPLSQQLGQQHPPRTSGPPNEWDIVDIKPLANVKAREANLDISLLHEAPCLVNEFYAVNLIVNSREKTDITNVKLCVTLKEGQDSSLEQNTHIMVDDPLFNGQVICNLKDLPMSSLSCDQQVERMVYLKCLSSGDRQLEVAIKYRVQVEKEGCTLTCHCQQTEHLTLPAVSPFDIAVNLASMQFDKIDEVHAEEPFLLLSDVRCTSPWPVHIVTTSVQLSNFVKCTDEVTESQLEQVSLKPREAGSECFCVVVPPSIQPKVPIGQYIVTWRRQSTEELPSVQTVLVMPTIAVQHVPLFVDVDLPAHGKVRESMAVTYNLYNRTPYSQEVELSMDSTDAFMFSGHKQVHFRILPNAKYEVRYNFVPLLPGNLPLPRLHVNMLRFPRTMDDIVFKMLPTHIFVQPSGKSGCSTPHPQHLVSTET